MNPAERRRQIEDLYHEALEQDLAARAAFVATACGSDEMLRREVEALLAHAQTAEGFLGTPLAAVAANALTNADATSLLGRSLGAYQIHARIGSGGMGEVYRAHDTKLGRDVAIKILPKAFTSDAERMARFEREAKSLAVLNHPNILTVHEIGTHDGQPYIVSELLEGQTLRGALGHGALPVKKAIDYAIQIAQGLAAAHEKRIVHRDLKPENLFITKESRVKILDFGLAKLNEAAVEGVSATMVATRSGDTLPGSVLGTVGYMSPEQVRGHAVDHRSDIFSVGSILYEMLSGARAFTGDTAADMMSAVLREQPPNLSLHTSTPPSLARIIHRCLEKDPSDRFQSVRDLHFAIELVSEVQSAAYSLEAKAHEKSIAVLPFANMNADPDNQYFSDGLSEELINALTQFGGLRVAARTSAFRFRARDVDIREIGRQLNVAAVLEGSVRRAGTRLRITAQLINVADGYHLWSDRYDRALADVFEIQDDITKSIVRALEPTLLGRHRPLVERHSTNLEAFEQYLKGQQLWYQRTPSSLRAAVASFEAAIRLDDHYALPHAGLAAAYSIIASFGFAPFAEARAAAEPAAARAMILDPLLAESHFAVALCTGYLSEQWETAEEHIRKSVEIQPQAALSQVYYGLFLALRHRFDEANARVVAAITLDPLSPFAHALGALAMFVARRYDDANRLGQRALELHPDFALALWGSGLTYCRLGQHDRSLPLFAKYVSLSQRTPLSVGFLGLGHARAGNTDEALTLLDELRARGAREYVVPLAPLAIQIGLGNRDDIYVALNDCVEQCCAASVEGVLGPFLDDLAEPRFAELFSRLHLVPRSDMP